MVERFMIAVYLIGRTPRRRLLSARAADSRQAAFVPSVRKQKGAVVAHRPLIRSTTLRDAYQLKAVPSEIS